MMDGQGISVNLSFLVTVMYALVGVGVFVLAVGLLAYRRAKRDGRWDRLMGGRNTSVTRIGPHRDIERLRERVSDALGSARGALDMVTSHGWAVGELPVRLEQLEEVGARLSGQLDLAGMRLSDEGLRRILPAVEGPVDQIEDLAGQFAVAVGAALGTTAGVELRELSSEVLISLSILRNRDAVLRELSAVD